MTSPLLSPTLSMSVTVIGSSQRSYVFTTAVNYPPSTTGLVVSADMTTAVNAAAAAILNQILNGAPPIQSLQQQVNNRAFNG